MLRSLKGLLGFSISARDGHIGTVKDFYFDDARWRIRYAVVDTGHWLPGRKVLIPPVAFRGEPVWTDRSIPVSLTKEMVRLSPSIDVDKPVDRQMEEDLARHFDWPLYWTGMPPGITAPMPDAAALRAAAATVAKAEGDPHLRSLAEVSGYRIEARDGLVGHLRDAIAGTRTWEVRYLVVDTAHWLPGRKVIVAPQWVDSVDWLDQRVHLGATAAQVKGSPEYDPSQPVNRQYEERLYDYYGRLKYWK